MCLYALQTQAGQQAVPYTAARVEPDFSDWLAAVLLSRLEPVWILRRPHRRRRGSWEAGLVRQLVRGTAGWEGEHLSDYTPASR